MDEIIYHQPLVIYNVRTLFTIVQFSFILERCSKKFFKWWTIWKPTSLHGSFYELRSLNNIDKSSAFIILSLINTKQGVCHIVALPFTLKRNLRQKKNYGNSNLSSLCKSTIFKKKKPLKETKILQDIITNLKFQHNQISSFKNRQGEPIWSPFQSILVFLWHLGVNIIGFVLCFQLFHVLNKIYLCDFFCIFCSFVLCYYVMWYWVRFRLTFVLVCLNCCVWWEILSHDSFHAFDNKYLCVSVCLFFRHSLYRNKRMITTLQYKIYTNMQGLYDQLDC